MSDLDQWKKFKGKTTPATVPLGKEFYEYVPKGSKVIDFGCAFGRISFELYEKGYEVKGIDINENEVSCAIENANKISALESNLSFEIANATKLPFSDKSFDAGVMVAFMVTVVNPKDRIKVLDEAYRVLNDRGILYLSAFGQSWDNEKYSKRYEEHFPITKEKGTFIVTDTHDINGKELYRCHHYSKNELNELLSKNFKILSWRDTTFKTPSGNVANGYFIVAQK